MTDQKANKLNADDNDESLILPCLPSPCLSPLHQDITHPQYLERGSRARCWGRNPRDPYFVDNAKPTYS